MAKKSGKDKAPAKREITREDKLYQTWYAHACEQTIATLPSFMAHLLTAYDHDVETCADAVTAAMLAASSAMAKQIPEDLRVPRLAPWILWEIIQEWNNTRGMPQRIVNFNAMLLPANGRDFNMIPKRAFEWVQARAKGLIERAKKEKDKPVAPEILSHWKSIVDGKVPFGYKVEKA